MASRSSAWGAVGWWTILALCIPFSAYAAVFVIGDFEVYRKFTLSWSQGKYDIAGLNILHNLRSWQIHALAAELFISTGLFQFSRSFRRKFPSIHRVMGYVFVGAGLLLSFTGVFFLVPHTEFDRVGQLVFTVQAVVMSSFLLVAVKMARAKKFQVHQRYMIRGAATGYSIMSLRIFPGLFMALGLPFHVATELATVLAPLLFLGISELYIQKVLLEPKLTTTTTQYAQASTTEEPEAMQSSKTDGDDLHKLVDSNM